MRQKFNSYSEIAEHPEVTKVFTNNKNSLGLNYFYVDTDKVEEIIALCCWCFANDYVQGMQGTKKVFLHRYLTEAKPRQFVDHFESISFDLSSDKRQNNTIKNLKPLDHARTNAINNKNSNIFKQGEYLGVTSNRKSWRSKIRVKGKDICVYHTDKEFCALAYDNLVISNGLKADYMNLNFDLKIDKERYVQIFNKYREKLPFLEKWLQKSGLI